MGKLPPFAPFPPAAVRDQISPEEWKNYLEAWILLAEAYLNAHEAEFNKVAYSSDSSITSFVRSYVQGHLESPNSSPSNRSQTTTLHKVVFLLCHRLLSMQKPVQTLLHWAFLAQFAHTFSQVSNLSDLLAQVWQVHSSTIEEGLQDAKKRTIALLDSRNSSAIPSDLQLVSHLIKVLPSVGLFFAVGSELMDSLASTFTTSTSTTQDVTTAFVYLILLSTIQIPKPNYSLLSDHLFTLRANASQLQAKNQPSVLSSLVSNTNFITKLRTMSESEQEGSNLPKRDYTVGLLRFKVAPTRARRSKSVKQKGKAPADTMTLTQEVHLHRLSRISHIQDFLPHLGSGFIAKCLDAYNEDEEVVLAALLDNNLPPHLANADQSESLQNQHPITPPKEEKISPLAPSFVPSRRNIFDNDELDNLTLDTSKLHIGKARQDLTADDMLAQKSDFRKAKIFASLAAFDPDEDEYDDTYDDGDVGGTIDNTVDIDRNIADDHAEMLLFRAWERDPSSFARDNGTRKSSSRASLRQETGRSDEQIEGFAIVLERDRNRVRALERKYANEWKGQQNTLDRRAWRATDEDEDSGPASGNDAGRGRGRGGFRGRPSGRGGRGAFSTAGPSDEKGTQRARQRKEVRGTHNRKDARGKKFSRGMA